LKRIKQQFNSFAEEYDKQRKDFIPMLDEFYSAGVRFVSCSKPKPEILDLGAGTGLFSSYFLRRFPEAKLTLLDFAPNMLGIARGRFAENSNVSFVEGDYFNMDFGGKKFDIIISALSFHHFPEEQKLALYGSIANLLLPGGEFVNADEVGSGIKNLDERYMQNWFDFVKKNLSEEDFGHFTAKTEIDILTPVSNQIAALKKHGLSSADCIFKNGLFAVLYAQKPV